MGLFFNILSGLLTAMKNKIKINTISDRCLKQKGFDERGCFDCACPDSCCKFGADFDAEAYELVIAHSSAIEPLIGRKVSDCFGKKWHHDPEYLGGKMIRSRKGPDGFCAFHNPSGKGCILYKLAMEKKAAKRIIPSICRVFPLTWDNGKLVVYDEHGNGAIPRACNCVEAANKTLKTVLHTRQEEFEDIFGLKYPCPFRAINNPASVTL